MKTKQEAENQAKEYINSCSLQGGMKKFMSVPLAIVSIFNKTVREDMNKLTGGSDAELVAMVTKIAEIFEVKDFDDKEVHNTLEKISTAKEVKDMILIHEPWWLSGNPGFSLIKDGAKKAAYIKIVGEVAIQYLKQKSPLL